MDLAAQNAVQNLHTFFLAQRHIAQKPYKVRLLTKQAPEREQLIKHLAADVFLLRQGIQAVAVFTSQFCHLSSPTFLMNSSTKES